MPKNNSPARRQERRADAKRRQEAYSAIREEVSNPRMGRKARAHELDPVRYGFHEGRYFRYPFRAR